jgi:hypothetical protein
MPGKQKRKPPPIPIEGGEPCPQCGHPMQRYKHGDADRVRYRTKYWDHCRPCKEGRLLGHFARTRGVRALGFGSYEVYLASPHWQAFRPRVFEAQRVRLGRNMCELCGKEDPPFHVHHLTYERLGNELIEDCQVICEPCHDELHGRDPRSRSRNYAFR